MLRSRRPLLKTERGRGVRSRSRYTWMLANRSGRGSSDSRRGRIDGVRGGRCRYRGRSGGGDVGGLSMLGSSLFLRWRRFRAVRRTLFARPLARARSLIRPSTTRLSVVHTFVIAPEAVVAFRSSRVATNLACTTLATGYNNVRDLFAALTARSRSWCGDRITPSSRTTTTTCAARLCRRQTSCGRGRKRLLIRWAGMSHRRSRRIALAAHR